MSTATNGTHGKNPLGRGLAALIPDDVFAPLAHDKDTAGLKTVALDSITPNPEQPRTHFDATALEELASSIREHGVLTPLLVRKNGDSYILIAGERRYRAAGMAGLIEVPVVVHDTADAAITLELALVENLQREDLDPIELARGFQRLQADYGYTQAEIAEKVGKDRSSVANSLRLLKLPAWCLELVSDGRLTQGHAKALLSVDDAEVLRRIVAKVLAAGMSVRATERLVKQRANVKRTVKVAQRRGEVVTYASELLTRSLGTGVAVKPRTKGGGRIVIDYGDDEELDRLITRLRGDR